MEKIVEQGLLYDFYGELLTEHQKEVFESAVYEDMSLTEIADEYGISKQGVSDLIKRCTASLSGYEDKLHMIRRFDAIKKSAAELSSLAESDRSADELREEISRISEEIVKELN